MNFNEAAQAVEEAGYTLRMSRKIIRGLLEMARGRLKESQVSGYVLAEIKKDLRDFNSVTHTWK